MIFNSSNGKYQLKYMITVKELHKSYAKQVALAGVSFDVDKATIFGLLGPNGAGKTTTINVLCGLLKPDSGSVSLNGKSDPARMDVRAKLAVVPQSLAIYEELSARTNLRFFGRIYGLTYKQLNQRSDFATKSLSSTMGRSWTSAP